MTGSPILSFLEDRSYGRVTKRQKVYTSLTPSSTIVNVVKEKVVLKRFTDTGELLLGFLNNYQSFVAYEYLGIECLANIYSVTSSDEAFLRTFRKRFVTTPGRELEGSFLLLTGGHAILLSTAVEGCHVIYTVSLHTGTLSDSFSVCGGDLDTGNVHVYQEKLVVLLRKRQEILVVWIDSGTGRFTLLNTIGEFARVSDTKLASGYPSGYPSQTALSAITHQLLVHWWRNAGPTHQDKVYNYFRHFNVISSLKLFSFQFLDKDTILIYYLKDNTSAGDDLFSVYNLNSTEIEAVFDNDAPALIDLISNNIYDFIVPTLTAHQASLFSRNNTKVYQSFIKSHFHHDSGVARKCRKILPFSCQSVHCSPYFDRQYFEWSLDAVLPFEMFTCDEARCEHQKEDVVFLLDRKPSFRLHYSSTASHFIFHPSEPVVVSAHRLNTTQSYTYHLHLRLGSK